MGYVRHGDARMAVMNPDGTLDTWTMTTGDMYFIPRAYPHHIKNIGEDPWHFLVFFDQPCRADIGYRASASAYSRKVLAAAFEPTSRTCRTFPSPRPTRRSSTASTRSTDRPRPARSADGLPTST
jgi:oxalate decarboxylase